ncbi:MAG: tRNA (N(6)-L-threonylcarbamoyladenosine(37)-C(2))-methylthiotransferase MtaB [Thermodesulfobacteriota bacterium]
MTTLSIATLGCKVNQFESEALMASLEQKGYHLVPFKAGADIAIINTCTVTQRADFQSRQMMRRAFRFNPKSLIVVTGCYSQVDPEAIARMSEVKYILGNVEKYRIPDLLPLIEGGNHSPIQVSDIQKQSIFTDTPLRIFHLHTRALLKIQDGCDARCSYCIVPYARGPSRSLPPESVSAHMGALKEWGYQEVVLTGIHLGSYGRDFSPPFPLEQLLRQLEEQETPCRIRLSSIEPMDFSKELIHFLSGSKKVCPHLHIPVQSAEDEILKRMNRNYDRSFLCDLIQELHHVIPGLSIGADVIVGFPGETEEKFRRTYEWIESLPFSYLHVFPFSKRKGTPAFHDPKVVAQADITRRAEAMRELGKQKRRTFYSRFLHRELNVLVEARRERATGGWRGLSQNYIPVLLPSEGMGKGNLNGINQEWTVKVTGFTETGLVGQMMERIRG